MCQRNVVLFYQLLLINFGIFIGLEVINSAIFSVFLLFLYKFGNITLNDVQCLFLIELVFFALFYWAYFVSRSCDMFFPGPDANDFEQIDLVP